MIRKVATFHLVDIDDVGNGGLVKLASSGKIGSDEARKKIEAEVAKHPTALFFRAKAIEADVPNNNGDSFSVEELKKACDTFVGVPFFTNHDNQDIERAKGKIVWSEWEEKDKAIYIVAFVDREAYPNLCRGIEEGYMTGVSMGCSVEYSSCSICGNKAMTLDEYCPHIRNLKGRTFSGTVKDVNTGEIRTLKNAKVYEDNYGIRFIELSGVADPACPTCRIGVVYNNGELCGAQDDKAATSRQEELLKAASVATNCYNTVAIMKAAALEKNASQSDLNALNQCLESIETVSVNLIQNRANVEMEFASDLVEILANLQDFVDQLVQAGYGQLPEASGQPVPGTLPEGDAANLGAAAPTQQISTEEDLAVGETNTETPLIEEPMAPSMQEFNEATRPAPSRQTSKLTRPSRPERKSQVEDDTEMRRMPNKSANDREQTKQTLDADWKEKMENMSTNLKETLKKDPAISGGPQMTSKTVEAKSQHSDLHEITEKQLEDAKVGANKREDDDREQITEIQLEGEREGEREVITEGQLDDKNPNSRTGEERDEITESQLEGSDPNARTNKEREVITQEQLDPERVGEVDVITEEQLSNPPVDTPWARSSSSAIGKHVEAAASILAKTVIATKSTPEQILRAACSFAGTTASSRLAFANEIWNSKAEVEDVREIAAKNDYWSGKGVKVASNSKTIREALVSYACQQVKDDNLNPELLLDAVAGIRDNDSLDIVEDSVNEVFAAASVQEEEVDARSQINEYLKSKKVEEPVEKEAAVEAEEIIEALSSEGTKVADHVIETTVEELGFDGDVESDEFKEVVASFTRGACTASNIKMASLVNVTIDGDAITIAVETDNESVEIPIGEEKEEVVEPMADVEEDVQLDAEIPVEEEAPAGQDFLGLASSKQRVKEAQFGGGAPEVPNAGGGAAPPEDTATMPDQMPGDAGIQTFTEDEPVEEDLPGEGEQMLPGSICPICGSDDTETGRKDQMPGQFDCEDCGAKYTMYVNIDLLNPEAVFEGAAKDEELEEPELPDMPVAASVAIDKDRLAKIANDFSGNKVPCPACGSDSPCSGTPSSHNIVCASCGTESHRDVIINTDKPIDSRLKVEWKLKPRKCAKCNEVRKSFAADRTFGKMLKSASTIEFPEKQARAWIDRNYGVDAVASYGPSKGSKLANVVIEQLSSFGLNTVKYMQRLCEVQSSQDPMDTCIEQHQKKSGYTKAEAERVCGCLKDKYAKEEDYNIFIEAFAGMMDVHILRKMAEHIESSTEVAEEAEGSVDGEMLISDIEVEAAAEKKVVEAEVGKVTAPDLKVEFEGADELGKTAGEEVKVEYKENKETGIDQTVLEDEEKVSDGKCDCADPDVPEGDGAIGGEKEAAPEEEELKVPVEDPDTETKALGVVAEEKKVEVVEDIEPSDDVPRRESKVEERRQRITQARREKAIRLASKMEATGQIASDEFDDMVSDLVSLPLDRMDSFATKVASSTSQVKTAGTLTASVIIEDRGMPEPEEEVSLTDKLAGQFTVGNLKADKYFKDGEVE